MLYTIKKTRKTESSTNGGLVPFDEFYERVGDTPKADLLDGKIIRESPIVPRHALVVTWIKVMIHTFVEKFDLGIVIGATVTVDSAFTILPSRTYFSSARKDRV